MSAVKIEPIGASNIEDVVALLVERNNTLPAYTRWKYDHPQDIHFRGVVARMDGKAIGCFGSIPRDLKLSSGKIISCNWFADWYVTPRVRGEGIGLALLQSLSAEGTPVFGHPGPPQAQALCRANGYREIGFQSCRRLILHRWNYEHKRTHYIGKALFQVLLGIYRSGYERYKATSQTLPQDDQPSVCFTTPETYRQWILDQPAISYVSRSSGVWKREDVTITYMDDVFEMGEVRRRVLHLNGNRSNDLPVWSSFVKDAKQEGCNYVEIFTTDHQLDFALMKLGAWRIPEKSVLVKGLPDTIKEFVLQGWDRENWTNLGEHATILEMNSKPLEIISPPIINQP